MSAGRRNLRLALEQLLNSKEDSLETVPAAVGAYVGGVQTIVVSGAPDFIWVRLRSNTSERVRAFNAHHMGVGHHWNLPILISRDPKFPSIWKVNGRDLERYVTWEENYGPGLPPHGLDHSFMFGKNIGSDPVWVAKRQFMPMLPHPIATGTSEIYIEEDFYYSDGAYHWFGGTGTLGLTNFRPTGAFNAAFVTVFIDGATSELGYLKGPEFNATFTPQDVGLVIAVPDGQTAIPIAAVYQLPQTTGIYWRAIYDLRGAQRPPSDPTGSNLGVWDEGNVLGKVGTMNFVGPNVEAIVSGTFAWISVTGAAGGGGEIGGATGTATYALVGVPEPVASITGQYWRTPGGRPYATGSMNTFIDGISQVKDLAFEEHMAESGTFRYFENPPTGVLHEIKFGVAVVAVGQVGPAGPTGSTGAQGAEGATGSQGAQGDPGADGPAGAGAGITILDDGIILGTGTHFDLQKDLSASISGTHVRIDVDNPTTGTVVLYDEQTLLGSVEKLVVEGDPAYASQSGVFGFLSFSGSVGPQGPEGATGSVGPQGPEGATGSVGSQGAEGATGSVGPEGPEGATGSVGSQGDEGATGSSGQTGPPGDPGAEGATGSIGPQGIEGATGSIGPQGAEGATGSIGPQGIEGATGSQGIEGATGSQGPEGPEGATGSIGTQGIEGATGSAGSQGDEGATGSVGSQGPEGATGSQGPQGAEGATGSPGTTDHGALTGLADDDHSQYVNIFGRPVKQRVSGSVDVLSDFYVSGSLIVDGIPAGIGTNNPLAEALHVRQGNSGATANSDWDDFILELGHGGAYGGMSLLAPDDTQIGIFFGSPSDDNWGQFFGTHDGGYLRMRNAAGSLYLDSVAGSEIVLNFFGLDVDTRIEGDVDPNLVYVDAGGEMVGIGTPLPAWKLHVSGSFGVSGPIGAFAGDVHVTGSVFSGDGSFHTRGWLQTRNRATPTSPPTDEGRWYQQSGTPYFIDDADEITELGAGAPGPQGPEGATGSVGPQGAEGATGSIGSQGIEGATGSTGAEGSAGAEGATGSQGPQGAEGATGSQGPQGAEGAGGIGVYVKDEGVGVGTGSTLDFVGAGVTAVIAGDEVTVTIPGGGGAAGTTGTNLLFEYISSRDGDQSYVDFTLPTGSQWKDLHMVASLRADRAASALEGLRLLMGDDGGLESGTVYSNWSDEFGEADLEKIADNDTEIWVGRFSAAGDTATAGTYGALDAKILDFQNNNVHKHVKGSALSVGDFSLFRRTDVSWSRWQNNNPIRTIRFFTATSSNFTDESFIRVYGMPVQDLIIEGAEGATGSPGTTDHGALTGLGDDDHSQYLHLGGRGGTQSVTGSVELRNLSGGVDLIINSTGSVASGIQFEKNSSRTWWLRNGTNQDLQFVRYFTGTFVDVPFEMLEDNGLGIFDHGLSVNQAQGSAFSDDFRVYGANLARLIFADASGDRVGINTDSPQSLFHVSGTFTAEDADVLGDAWVKDYLNVSGSYYVHGGSGDVNQDGAIDVLDVQIVANWLTDAAVPTADTFRYGDVDGDGIITWTDHKRVVDMFLGSEKNITDKILRIGLRTDTDYLIDYDLAVGGDFAVSGSFNVPGDYTLWEPMAPPVSPYSMAGLAQDDEFDDANFASGTIWHWYDEPGGLVVTEAEYGVVLSGVTANNVQAVWQPIPTGTNYSFTTFLSPIHEQADDQKWGIILIQNTGSMVDSDAYIWSAYRGGAGYGWQATFMNAYNDFNADDYNSVSDSRPAGMFIRFRLEGSTWHFDWSEDGFHWVEDRYTRAERFTIQGIGIGGRGTDTDYKHIFSFARWTADGGDDQVLNGARVRGWYK